MISSRRIISLTSGKVHVIVHGHRDLLKRIVSALVSKGFSKEDILAARMDEAGKIGDYVAMAWPPVKPQEIVISQIVGNNQPQEESFAPGAWEAIQQNELYRISLG